MGKVLVLAGLIATLAYLTLTKSGRDVAEQIGASIVDFSSDGAEKLKRIEGFSPVPYRDAQGWSIGYGHFILTGESFSEIDEAQADALLRKDAAKAVAAVNDYVSVPLNQNQFDALVSFTYNIGVKAFRNSTLLAKLNAGDYTAAAAQFARWNKSQGEVLAALVARRELERGLFLA